MIDEKYIFASLFVSVMFLTRCEMLSAMFCGVVCCSLSPLMLFVPTCTTTSVVVVLIGGMVRVSGVAPPLLWIVTVLLHSFCSPNLLNAYIIESPTTSTWLEIVVSVVVGVVGGGAAGSSRSTVESAVAVVVGGRAAILGVQQQAGICCTKSVIFVKILSSNDISSSATITCMMVRILSMSMDVELLVVVIVVLDICAGCPVVFANTFSCVDACVLNGLVSLMDGLNGYILDKI